VPTERPSAASGPRQLPRQLTRLHSRRAFVRGTLLASGAALLTACGPLTRQRPPALSTGTPATTTADGPQAAPTVVPAFPPLPVRTNSRVGTAAARPVTAPRSGGTLVSARTAGALGLDPQLTASQARQRITMLTYNNLVKLSNEVSIQPDLAESWRVSPDGKQIDFALRQGVRWHPPVGRELVAEDVKFSYERLLRESPGRADFAAIESIEVLDKYHVRFLLTAPSAGLLASMADSRWGAIVNREAVQQHGHLRMVAVGTGPFILDARHDDHELRFRRNPEYFERGKPHLEALVVRTVPDEAEIVAGLGSGAIHHAMLDDNRYYEQLKHDPGLTIHRAPRLGYDFLCFNQATPPFNKPEVIQAISYAVDRDACIRVAAGGYAVQTPPCPPSMKQWQLSDDGWRQYYAVDLQRARTLLAQAGYPDGFEATLLTISSLPALVTNAQVVQASLQRVGITLKIEALEYSRWLTRWQAKAFEATLNTTSGYPDPDTAFYRALHSKAQNWNNLANPELDRLLEEGRTVYEVDRRKPIYDRVQRLLLERPGHLYLFAPEAIDVTQKRVRGFSQHPTTTLWSCQHIWLDG
jgi:peptide/nickel transport system substrate-binding protein